MLYTAQVPISFRGSRVEPGEVIDVTPEELANIADVVVPVSNVVADAPAEEVEG